MNSPGRTAANCQTATKNWSGREREGDDDDDDDDMRTLTVNSKKWSSSCTFGEILAIAVSASLAVFLLC